MKTKRIKVTLSGYLFDTIISAYAEDPAQEKALLRFKRWICNVYGIDPDCAYYVYCGETISEEDIIHATEEGDTDWIKAFSLLRREGYINDRYELDFIF